VREKQEIFHRLQTAIACKRGPAYKGTFLWRFMSAGFSRYTPLVATVIIFVLMGGGAALAQDTIPGDFLYPLKRVQERIHSTIKFSAASKAEMEASHMDRRVEEATKLKVRGELTEEASIELDNEYRRERREALKNVKTMESAGSSQAAASLRARMKATEDRYERLFKGARRRQPDQDIMDEEEMLGTESSSIGL
jgi:hypothetical protein